jgi:hypothetical protein
MVLPEHLARLLDRFYNKSSGALGKLAVDSAVRLIKQHKLGTVAESWHYSWNLEQFYDEMMIYEHRDRLYVFHDAPINEWSPAPLFSNDPMITAVLAKRGKDCPFWLLKLKTFDDFLARRSAGSSNPQKNFPSTRTYPKLYRKLGCRLERFDIAGNEGLFVRWYDELKDKKYHHSGAKCLSDAFQHSFRAPREWFKFYLLFEEESDSCKAVLLAIEDDQSSSGINIASLRKNGGGYGVFLDVEVIRSLCERNYQFYDSGISGYYGNSKDMIFLDRLPTDSSGDLVFLKRLGVQVSP